ncbi:hypothetical protein AB833_04140 [Chromatiales bacterium (ex Bugula neritina AB1)]|nr:hypothetical protein AB833_04140 [Chromatiales bacterium (ex Bugula neritina AB1)]
MNRPDSSNSLTPELVEALITALSITRPIRLCVIRANGRNFCAGFDLSDIDSLSDGDLLLRFVRLETLLQRIHHATFPVLVLTHGHAVGAGADIVVAAGSRIAAPGSTFRMPGWQFGIALGTRRLTDLIGTDGARDLLIDTRVVNETIALQMGLISEVVAQVDWSARIAEVLQRSSALPHDSLQNLLALTIQDTRAADMAALSESASVPGLKERIVAYRQRVQQSRKR